MQLTKSQTFEILYKNNKKQILENKNIKFTSKTEWKCLSCLDNIYISFRQWGRKSIFCKKCFKTFSKKYTIVQFHYMKKVKEKQLKFMENYGKPQK